MRTITKEADVEISYTDVEIDGYDFAEYLAVNGVITKQGGIPDHIQVVDDLIQFVFDHQNEATAIECGLLRDRAREVRSFLEAMSDVIPRGARFSRIQSQPPASSGGQSF